MLVKVAQLIHLLGFAAFIGAAAAQQHFMHASRTSGILPAMRDDYERLCATIVTKIELPALFAQVFSGVLFVTAMPGFMKLGWMHGKLLAVLVLLVLSHVEMFNARAVARLRQRHGESAAAEISKRKQRHLQLGGVGTLAVAAVVALVVFAR
ncbi:MAG TPA: hypothetical protein VJR89_23145 [Polyangiales bacterium]|nr:hypothetical protein [Polyangiales bacterium]